MRALLDVNVLVALFDADHTFHATALDWFDRHGKMGWASCPITQNGCVRIMSQPAYPNSLPVHTIAERLREAVSDPHHEFWPDDRSLLDATRIDTRRIHGPRPLTDVYLLDLAVAHGGRFVTFDQALSTAAVAHAGKRHLVIL